MHQKQPAATYNGYSIWWRTWTARDWRQQYDNGGTHHVASSFLLNCVGSGSISWTGALIARTSLSFPSRTFLVWDTRNNYSQLYKLYYRIKIGRTSTAYWCLLNKSKNWPTKLKFTELPPSISLGILSSLRKRTRKQNKRKR